ncbi:hypothetical protein [Massilia sp.]|uniref:hypothetical protein n=1 Tax=Massilia sp. TaxID=1882437 RepID=UPI00352E3299
MNPAVQAVICGKRRTKVTQTFTGNATWTAPTTTNRADASGYGARGTSSPITVVQQYTLRTYNHVVHSDGSSSNSTLGNYGPYSGAAPGDYCDPLSDPDISGNRSQICYDYTDTSYTTGGTTTGASATAFGKTFPGSTGNVAPTTTTFSDIPITPGATYNIVVPAGGTLTITYFQ